MYACEDAKRNMKEIYLELIIVAIIQDDIWKKCFQHNFRKRLKKEETGYFSLLVCGGKGLTGWDKVPTFSENPKWKAEGF